MPSSMFNCRVEPELLAAIEKAAAEHGIRKSVWAREVLAAAASGLFDPMAVRGDGQVSPHPARFLALQAGEASRAKANGDCVHPVTAIKELPFTDLCGVCGVVVRTR